MTNQTANSRPPKEPTLWQALTSQHYVGWTTPFMEGAIRGAFWAHVICWPIAAVVLLVLR